jgi:hypothetical protein
VAERNWRRIETAPKGIGPLLLRADPSSLDPAFVGYQADDGRWFAGAAEVSPAYYCEIPQFDADVSAGGEPTA